MMGNLEAESSSNSGCHFSFRQKLHGSRIKWQYRLAGWRRDFLDLKEEAGAFFLFASLYLKQKLIVFAEHFEAYKSALVNLLMAKRGRYSRPFLNLSVFILVGAGFATAPLIKENHPVIGSQTGFGDFVPPSAVATSISSEEVSTTTAISEKPRDKVIEYQVQKGDTLSTIAEQFGVSADTIRWANDIKEKNPTLQIGEKLDIPPLTGVVHKVRKGETVYSIAEKYKTEPQKIVNYPFNEFSDLETFALQAGQVLVVPDGVIGRAKPTPGSVPAPQPRRIAEGSGKFIWPAGGRITQYYVWYHKGLDIANKSAPGIAAADGGTVAYVGCHKWGYGCHVRIDHGKGIETLYAHLQRYYVSVGQNVAKGELIGQMGSTGRSTGTHLHFEVRKNGTLVNPLNYLQ